MLRWGKRAIVAGGSLAGLLAARVLAPRFDEILLIERDRCLADEFASTQSGGTAAPRKGVPQGRHVHGLLPSGGETIERLFPGILSEIEADGAIPSDLGADIRWFHFGGYKRRFRSGLSGQAQSRPLLEWHVRRRCSVLANVAFQKNWEVVGLVADPDGIAVAGVEARPLLDGTAGAERITADLVVDATGRGSRAGTWLEALGHERPRESAVHVGVSYTTRLYRRRPGDLDAIGATLLAVYPQPPAERRFGVAFPIEGERWIVTLGGWMGEAAPTNESGFLDYARDLPAPDIHDLIRRVEPVSGFAVHKFPSNLRRHYEAVQRPPAGFLAIGDALCSFNPVYGQGMTVAALEAEALGQKMAAVETNGDGPRRLPRAFFGAAGRIIDRPWALAVGEDFRFPGVTGPRPPAIRFLNWYIGKLHETATMDEEVHRAFLDVMNLTHAPATVFRPDIACRVLRHCLSGGRPGPIAGAAVA